MGATASVDEISTVEGEAVDATASVVVCTWAEVEDWLVVSNVVGGSASLEVVDSDVVSAREVGCASVDVWAIDVDVSGLDGEAVDRVITPESSDWVVDHTTGATTWSQTRDTATVLPALETPVTCHSDVSDARISLTWQIECVLILNADGSVEQSGLRGGLLCIGHADLCIYGIVKRSDTVVNDGDLHGSVTAVKSVRLTGVVGGRTWRCHSSRKL